MTEFGQLYTFFMEDSCIFLGMPMIKIGTHVGCSHLFYDYLDLNFMSRNVRFIFNWFVIVNRKA